MFQIKEARLKHVYDKEAKRLTVCVLLELRRPLQKLPILKGRNTWMCGFACGILRNHETFEALTCCQQKLPTGSTRSEWVTLPKSPDNIFLHDASDR